MHATLLAALALCNVPLYLYPQQSLPEADWPTHAVVAMPQGWLKDDQRLQITEDGQPMLAQVEVAARWPDGSAKWAHAFGNYRYRGGKPAKYAAMLAAADAKVPESRLTVRDDPGAITIETGVITLVIARPFAGITLLEHQGEALVKGAGGPTLVDSNGVSWRAALDREATVVVEQHGPARVTIKAEGWYRAEDAGAEPFCRFVTRISAFVNSGIIKIDHATVFADDMKEHDIAELAFRFPLEGATAFSSPTHRGTFGDKLRAAWLAQLTHDRQWRINQTGADPAKNLLVKGDFERGAGWCSASFGKRRLALLAKDFWQKCPKELKISPNELVYFPWPEHGELAQADPTATRIENLYKFLCFQSGDLLCSRLPDDYFQALVEQKDTTECKPEYARAANFHGISMHNEFALAVVAESETAKQTDDYLSRLHELFVLNPLCRMSPQHLALTKVLGEAAGAASDARHDPFAAMEQFVVDGMLGYARSIERYNDYGWAIYGNTHHEELMNPNNAGIPQGRPTLHRVWNNNHYEHCSTSWRLFALNGDARMLTWARTCTDTFASVGMVRYDKQWDRDADNPQRRPSIKYHKPGSFFHCKGLVPWGGRDYGMDKDDVDASDWGHWIDPSALLLAWLIDANRWALDGYQLWRTNLKTPTHSTPREINNTLVHLIQAYEFQPDEQLLELIRAIRAFLTEQPILARRPGPIWEPSWLSRYSELFPDDEEFRNYLVQSADEVGTGDEGSWSLALSASAYRITGDQKYLLRHGATLERVQRQLFRDANRDKRWEGYGVAPGPGRDRHAMLQWHRFRGALAQAKLNKLPVPEEPGHYLCSRGRFDNSQDIASRGMRILIYAAQPATIPLEIEASHVSGGDIQATSLTALSPGGKPLLNVARLLMSDGSKKLVYKERASTWRVAVEQHPIQADERGLYTVLFGSHEVGLFQPLSKLPECQVLQNSKIQGWREPVLYTAKLSKGYLVPLAPGRLQLTFAATGVRDGSHIVIRDRRGRAILDRWLRAGESETATLAAERGASEYWQLDAFSDSSGCFTMSISGGVDEPLLFGRDLEAIQLIRKQLAR